jgi:hypothetical protein
MLLDMLTDGRLHVSGIAVLAPILTEANRETVLARATHKTKARIKELVAELAPKPDVPSSKRKSPDYPKKSKPATPREPELRPDGVNSEMPSPPTTTAPSTPPAVVEPIAEARYKVAFTASAGFRDKLERLKHHYGDRAREDPGGFDPKRRHAAQPVLPDVGPLADAVRAHQRQVIHGDLKPGNVMQDEKGRLKILNRYRLAFFNHFVKGKARSPLLNEPVSGFPEVTFQTAGHKLENRKPPQVHTEQ